MNQIPGNEGNDDFNGIPMHHSKKTNYSRNPNHSNLKKKDNENSLFAMGESSRSGNSLGSKVTGRHGRKLKMSIAKAKLFSPPKKFAFFPFQFPHQNSFSERDKKAKAARAGQLGKKRRKTKSYDGPTPLHTVCKLASNVDDIHSFLESPAFSQKLATVKDDDARTPLHLFSMNKSVHNTDKANTSSHSINYATSIDDKAIISECVLNYILPSDPTAMTVTDKNGYIPFEHSIVEWISAANEKTSSNMSKRSFRNKSSNSNDSSSESPKAIHEIFISKGKAVIEKAGIKIGKLGPASNVDDFHGNNGYLSDGSGQDIVAKDSEDWSNDLHTKSFDPAMDTDQEFFPIDVNATPSLLYTLDILSVVIEYFEKRHREEKVTKSINSKTITNNNKSFRFNKSPKKSYITGTRGSMTNGQAFNVPPPIASDLDAVFANKISSNINDPAQNEQRHDTIRNSIIHTIASIPNLMKTLLLIEDGMQRKLVFDFPIIREIVFNKDSIGPWLVEMLKSQEKRVSEKAVHYLKLLSGDDERQFRNLYNDKAYKQGDISSEERVKKTYNELYEAVSLLDGLIPSLLGLDERMIEQAATTQIISRVLDKMVLKPFAVSVVFFDVLFLSALILSFRFSTTKFLHNDSSGDILKWIYSANACNIYFIVRELGKAISLSMFTRKSFALTYFWTVWNLVDVLSIVMSLTSTILMRLYFMSDDYSLNGDSVRIRICLAVTIGLLWIRVLGLAKTINVQLATFVLAIVQITRDIIWFLLILLAQVISFAQMFHILLVPSNCKSTSDDFCNIWEYYLKVYSILLGDFGEFDREDFSTIFSITLAVSFTFMVVIVLLNVLIAIVSDSYEKCLLRSEYLFGRARVMLLAELVSFQHLLRQNTTIKDNGKVSKSWKKESKIFFLLSVFVMLTLIAGEVTGFLTGTRKNNSDFAFNIGSIIFLLFLLVVIFFVLIKGASTASSPHTISTRIIQWIMFRFIRTSADSWDVTQQEEWKGQVNYLQKEMSRLATETTEHTRSLIQQEIQVTNVQRKQLERKINESEERIMSQLQRNQQQLNQIIAMNVASDINRPYASP